MPEMRLVGVRTEPFVVSQLRGDEAKEGVAFRRNASQTPRQPTCGKEQHAHKEQR